MDKVSILIPVYNGEDTIEDCINSVKCQTYKNIDIIVVDDGSTDNTINILNNISNIKVYRNYKNKGLGYTRNILIKKCKTKYFMFLDSDDTLVSNAVEIMYNNIIKYNSDIVMGRLNNNSKDIIILDNNNKYNLMFKNIDKRYMIQQNKLYKKSIFKNLEYPNESFADDEFMIHKIINNCQKIVIINNKTYNYNEYNGMHTAYHDKYNITIRAYYERYKYFKNTKYEKQATFMLRNIHIYYYKVFYKERDIDKLKIIKKEYNKILRLTNRYIRIRDIIFYFFPNIYCIIRKI